MSVTLQTHMPYFSNMFCIQVFVAAFRNRKLKLPDYPEELYEIDMDKEDPVSSTEFLAHRDVYRFDRILDSNQYSKKVLLTILQFVYKIQIPRQSGNWSNTWRARPSSESMEALQSNTSRKRQDHPWDGSSFPVHNHHDPLSLSATNLLNHARPIHGHNYKQVV